MKGTLFIVSGPSGAGKGTLVSKLVQDLDGLSVSVSATTRKPRPGERDGIEYHFMSDVQFDALVEENGFLEWAQVHGQRYGTLADDVTRVLASGRDVILEIDVQGGLQVKERYPDSVLVFIEPPSLDVLRQRLQGRGTESGEALERRLETARVELTYKERYNAVIINDSLAAAAAELTNLIVRHRSERGEA